jgi:Tfp pilus assembly pilus retraction ATPase PilT
MQTGKKYGMKLMDDSLVELVESGIVEPREAFIRAENPQNLVKYMQG